jgi:formate hydrogenlyase transcriptional activator
MKRLPISDRYQLMREINKVTITQRSTDDVFRGASRVVKRVLNYDRAGLMLYEPEQDDLKIAAVDGTLPTSFFQIGARLSRKETPHGAAFDRKRVVLRRNIQQEYEFAIEEYTMKEGLKSFCAVPLVIRGNCLGVMSVLSFRERHFADTDVEFLQEVSDEIVGALSSLIPSCIVHTRSKLICPRCIASSGGKKTTAKYREQLSDWGKKGGRRRTGSSLPRQN